MTKSNEDEWTMIFNSLTIEQDPPMHYIKDVVVTTKSGNKFNLTPKAFEDLVEREKSIAPEDSVISSCKLSLNMTKFKRDVDKWAKSIVDSFDETGLPPQKKKPRAKKNTVDGKK
jgi:hypothetical protein